MAAADLTHVSPVGRSWCSPPPKTRRSCCCVAVDGPPPQRPDLAIYSQEEQLALGVPPTWDSPDILTNYWSPFRLMPEVNVSVRNLSATAFAANAQIALFISQFGIGMPQSLLSAIVVSLAPGQSTTLLFPLTQAILNAPDQRIGTYVRITHPSDIHLINNKGAQLLADAYTSAVGRSFAVTFPVMNPLATAQQITLSVLPNVLNASVQPAVRVFNPLEQVIATLNLQAPNSIHGSPGGAVREDATVVAYGADGKLIGGLTYVIWIDN